MAFWTLECMATFRTGFYRHGGLETRPAHVAKRYLRTWFLFDAGLLAIDVASLSTVFLSNSLDGDRTSRSTGVLRILKAARFLRLAALLRMARVSNHMQRIKFRTNSGSWAEVVVAVLLDIRAKRTA